MSAVLTAEESPRATGGEQVPARPGPAPWLLAALCAAVYFVAPGRSLDYDSSITVGLFVRPRGWTTPLVSTDVFNNHTLFSLVEWCVWHAGGRSEAALRVAPILFAAATVWVLVAWVQRRWGALPAVAAGAVLIANPMFATLSRDVRGYSLATLGLVVATCWLADNIERDDPPLSAPFVLGLGVAVATNVMCLLVVGAHVVAVIASGRRRRGWWANLSGGLILGLAILSPTLGQLIDATRSQTPRFMPRFPLDAWSAVTAPTVVGGIAVGASTLVGIALVLRPGRGERITRRPFLIGAIALGLALGAEWLVLRPPNLDPRFVVWLVPAAAIAAVIPLRADVALVRRVCGGLLVVGLVATVVHEASTWTQPEEPLREVAAWVRTHRDGATACADGAEDEAFLGYDLRLEPLVRADDASKCGLVVQIGAPSKYDVIATVDQVLPVTTRFHGRVDDIVVHTRS